MKELTTHDIATIVKKQHVHIKNKGKALIEASGRDAALYERVFLSISNDEHMCYALPADILFEMISGYNLSFQKEIMQKLDEQDGLELECTRCGHKWIKKNLALPKTCPYCRTQSWDNKRE